VRVGEESQRGTSRVNQPFLFIEPHKSLYGLLVSQASDRSILEKAWRVLTLGFSIVQS